MDPSADLVDWIALYGVLGLPSIGLAEDFVPALPSDGILVSIGIAASDDGAACYMATTLLPIVSSSAVAAQILVLRVAQDGRFHR